MKYKFVVDADGGGFICTLCNTGCMSSAEVVRSHLGGTRHNNNIRRMATMTRVEFAQKYDLFIDGIVHPQWRNQMKSDLYDYILSKKPENISNQLKKYQKLERVTLLELAVWKANCLYLDGSGNFQTMQDIIDQWTMDETFDPATYKAERRFTATFAVIIRSVVQFLD
jgi:hypothetical protein